MTLDLPVFKYINFDYVPDNVLYSLSKNGNPMLIDLMRIFIVLGIWEYRGGKLFPEPEDPLIHWFLEYLINIDNFDSQVYCRLFNDLQLDHINEIYHMENTTTFNLFREEMCD